MVRLNISYNVFGLAFGASEDTIGSSYLHLRWGKGRIRSAQLENIYHATSSIRSHAFVLMGQQLMRCDLLGNLCQGVWVGDFLIHLLQLLSQSAKSFEKCVEGDWLARAPCKRFVELQRDEIAFLLLLLRLSSRTPARRHGARQVSVA